MSESGQALDGAELGERQAAVLRAVVMSYVADAAPIGSKTISTRLPMNLSPASIRNTLAELSALGLLEKPHASSGRVPTELGLRLFIDRLLDAEELDAVDRRTISYSMAMAAVDTVAAIASQLLSERTRQLGFVVAPRLDRISVRHVSLVRLTTDQVLAVLVSQTGAAHRRVIADATGDDQATLDRIATVLNERIVGLTLVEAREGLAREARALRNRADRWMLRVIELGALAVAPDQDGPVDLVLGTRLALLEQPEFHDPERIRDLFATVETKERLVEILDEVISAGGTRVAFGDEVHEPGLHRCALVASSYGVDTPIGVLGVIGPSRMDYGRVIPLVDYLSQAITEKFSA